MAWTLLLDQDDAPRDLGHARVAWRITDHLSLGMAFNAMYGALQQDVAVQNLEPQSDGRKPQRSPPHTWGFGVNAGLLYSAVSTTRLGLTYTSPVKLNFASTPSFSDSVRESAPSSKAARLDTAIIDVGMTVPQTLMLGFYQAIGDRWAVMGGVGWQNWAAFGAVEIGLTSVNTPSLTTRSLTSMPGTWRSAPSSGSARRGS